MGPEDIGSIEQKSVCGLPQQCHAWNCNPATGICTDDVLWVDNVCTSACGSPARCPNIFPLSTCEFKCGGLTGNSFNLCWENCVNTTFFSCQTGVDPIAPGGDGDAVGAEMLISIGWWLHTWSDRQRDGDR